MEDPEDEVNKKIKKAFCPPQNIHEGVKIHDRTAKNIIFNPILSFCETIIYPSGKIISVKRTVEFGGDKDYPSYEEVLKDFEEGTLHPADLKPAVSRSIN